MIKTITIVSAQATLRSSNLSRPIHVQFKIGESDLYFHVQAEPEFQPADFERAAMTLLKRLQKGEAVQSFAEPYQKKYILLECNANAVWGIRDGDDFVPLISEGRLISKASFVQYLVEKASKAKEVN